MELKISDSLKKLATALDSRLYIVGGYIRNAILGVNSDDIDICSPYTSEQVQEKCKEIGLKTKIINAKLGTLLITANNGENYEYTPFRKENYIKGNHLPESVEFVDDILVDAKRRDFTCNAIYYNVLTEQIFDPYNGRADIEKKVLKCIETPLFVFSSDGLRLLRMIRFACELGFRIDAKTFKTASEMIYQLKFITPERKLMELEKIVVADYTYGAVKNEFVRCFNALNIYKYLFGLNYENFSICIKGDEYQNLFKAKKELRILAFLVLFLLNKYGFKYMHENQVNGDIMMLFNNLRISKELASDVVKTYLCLQNLKFKPLNEFSAVDYHNLTQKQREVVNLFVDFKPVGQLILDLKMSGVPLSMTGLAVCGDDLKPLVLENKISQVLKLLFEMCLTGKVKNEKDALIQIVKTIKFNK